MKAPFRAMQRRIPSRTKRKTGPRSTLRAHREVGTTGSAVTSVDKWCLKSARNLKWKLNVPSGLCWSQEKRFYVWLCLPAGWPCCWDEERGLPGRSAHLSQTGPAQTGELRGFPTVKKQQTESHHCAGNQRCCHTCTTEDSHESCCVKSRNLD